MTEWIWKKLSFYAGWLAIAVLFALLFLSANIEIKDFDLWLHLAMGRFIVTNFSIPTVDVLSHTVSGQPWINHEWLFQVIIYYAHHFAGIDGLIYLRLIILGITFLTLLILGYNKEKSFWPIFVLGLVLMVFQFRLTLRPDIFSMLFFVLYAYILAYRIDRRGSIFVLFLLQVFWTNIHGFFIFGPLLVLIAGACEWLKRHIPLAWSWNRVGRLSADEFRNLQFILVAVLVACFINPYFYKGALYPLKVLFSLSGDSKIFFEYIVELSRPLTWDNLFLLNHLLPLKLLILISFISFFFNYHRIDIGAIFFWVVFLIFGLSAMRNIVYLAVVCYLVFLTNSSNFSFDAILPDLAKKKRIRYLASIVLKVILIFWLISYMGRLSYRGYFDFDTFTRKSELGGVSLRNYPYKAVDFLYQNNIKGNFFNDFNSGAYLLGRLHPDIRVFIDGRTEVYGAEFYKTYQKMWLGNAAALDVGIEHYQISGAFLNSVNAYIPKESLLYFYEHKDWHLVYFDYDATIFLKDIPLNKTWIDQYKMDFKDYNPQPADIIRLGAKNVTPYQHLSRSYTLFHVGLFEKAEFEVGEALKIKPNYAKAHKLMGQIGLEQKEYLKAFEHLRKSKVLDPSDREVRFFMAKSLYYLGKFKEAQEQCLAALKYSPHNSKGLFLLAKIYAQQRIFDQSMEILQKAVQLNPENIEQILQLSEVLLELKERELAEHVLGIALESDPTNKDIQNKINALKL